MVGNASPADLTVDQRKNIGTRIVSLLKQVLRAVDVLEQDDVSLISLMRGKPLADKVSHLKTYVKQIKTKLEEYIRYWKRVKVKGKLPWIHLNAYNHEPILLSVGKIYHVDEKTSQIFMKAIDEIYTQEQYKVR